MKRTNIVAIVFFIAVAMFVLYFSIYKNTSDNMSVPVVQNGSEQGLITVRIDKSVEEATEYSIEKSIPTVSGSVSPFVLANINNTLRGSVDSIVKDFKDETKDISIIESAGNAGGQSKHTLSVSVLKTEVIGTSYLTVRLVVNSYVSGAAHPLMVTRTYNFNIKNGKLVNLNSIFDSGQNYLERVSILAKEKIKKTLLQSVNNNKKEILVGPDVVEENPEDTQEDTLRTVFFEEGADPREENYSTYLIEKEGVRFIFGQYQVVPYVYGEQEIVLTYDEIQNILNPSFEVVK